MPIGTPQMLIRMSQCLLPSRADFSVQDSSHPTSLQHCDVSGKQARTDEKEEIATVEHNIQQLLNMGQVGGVFLLLHLNPYHVHSVGVQ